jgi:hypothetical protein
MAGGMKAITALTVAATVMSWLTLPVYAQAFHKGVGDELTTRSIAVRS